MTALAVDVLFLGAGAVAVVAMLTAGRAMPSARAASLRPQPRAASSRSGIDYRGERG